nr:RNA-directed DNA polymerase, eukaryota [Tanacetum cinerariifolium]
KGDGEVIDVNRRHEVVRLLQDVEKIESLEVAQKAKIKWAIEAPGPDGFIFGFYRRYWNLIESDVVDVISCFFQQGVIPKEDLFPRMYALESLKSINVAPKLSHCGLAVSFRRNPRGRAEQAQFDLLKEKVEGCVLVDMFDRWVWSLEGSGDFTVSSVRKLIDDVLLPEVSTKTRWIKAVPIKVNVHAWKVKIDCLPTRLNISRRGMDIESILCPICGNVVESFRHLLFTCH